MQRRLVGALTALGDLMSQGGNHRTSIKATEERVEWPEAGSPQSYPISIRDMDSAESGSLSYEEKALQQLISCYVEDDAYQFFHAVVAATVDMSSTADLQNVWNILSHDGTLEWTTE